MNITKKSYRDYFFTHPVVASNPRFHWLSPMETASVSRCLVVRGDWITTSQPIYVSYVSSLVRASLAVRASFHSRLKHFHFTLASRRRLLIPIQLTSVIPATFYRAMLCIARTMPSQDVCPSVHLFLCLSVTRRYSGNGCTYPQNFFSASDTHIILLFPFQTVWQYSDGDLLTGASNARGYEKIAMFNQYIALSRNWYKIEP